MRSDRELLELAARAAGISGRFIEHCLEDGAQSYSCGIGNAGWITQPWNPLTNDGDALRLAVTLGLAVDAYNFRAISGSRLAYGHKNWIYGDPDEEYDEYEATRRAITRAAAEIGASL